MNTAYLSKPVQTNEGWRVNFALQIFHRTAEDWVKMRWGFNAAALLEEALDRQKLFIETQALSEAAFLANEGAKRTLAMRVINLPEDGLQIALLGRVDSVNREKAVEEAANYAGNVQAIFPQDFIVRAAESPDEYEKLYGASLFNKSLKIVLIQRANAPFPSKHGYGHLTGLWQSSLRSSEQVWRALYGAQKNVMLNITIQPSILFEGEKEYFLEIKKAGTNEKGVSLTSSYNFWVDQFIKRRLAAWKRFFLMQVHVLAEGGPDENLVRSIGAAITRDPAPEIFSPGYSMLRPGSAAEERDWLRRVQTLEFVPSPMRTNDVADLEEVFSVFRLPYIPEAGLPGTKFIDP